MFSLPDNVNNKDKFLEALHHGTNNRNDNVCGWRLQGETSSLRRTVNTSHATISESAEEQTFHLWGDTPESSIGGIRLIRIQSSKNV